MQGMMQCIKGAQIANGMRFLEKGFLDPTTPVKDDSRPGRGAKSWSNWVANVTILTQGMLGSTATGGDAPVAAPVVGRIVMTKALARPSVPSCAL